MAMPSLPARARRVPTTPLAPVTKILEDSGNTLEVAKLETEAQKEAVDKQETASTMLSFKAISGDGQITLEWTSGDSTDGFNVLRSEVEEAVQTDAQARALGERAAQALRSHGAAGYLADA